MRISLKQGVRATLAAALVVAGASVVAGCGSSGGGAQTFNVSVDGTNKAANDSFLDYFPSSLRVHPGDSVAFTWNGPGEPHTVTFGTLVDATLSAFRSLPPAQQQNPPQAVIALDAKIPQLLPQGPGDAIQDGANPCFVASGTPPSSGPCPPGSTDQSDFDGTQSYFNSGWQDPGDTFTLTVSKSTAPGTYEFLCLLHREGMTGKMTVVDKGTKIPTPDEVSATGAKQLAAIEAKLAPAEKLLVQGKPPVPLPLPASYPVLAGSASSDESVSGSISEFGPKTIHVPVGGSVTWFLIGPHSITFNSDKSNDDIRSVAKDGTIHLNAKALLPANSPGEPHTPLTGGSATKPRFDIVAEKTWDGVGFMSSGVFANSFGPPVIEGYQVTFTKAGTYKYLCTVHDDMKGTVVVG